LARAGEAFAIRHIDPRRLKAEFRRQTVPSPYREPAGTIVVAANHCLLHLVQEDGSSIRYGVAAGRAGFGWSGVAEVGRKAKWPPWAPTEGMNAFPSLTYSVEGGPGNPLGARALYLHSGGRDTLYRIHGGGDLRTIGRKVSSGCIRLLDQDIVDLYERVAIGAKVIVLA
jgi:lipoprotein-anchoring transpeptidase ErfK/SrfK